MVAEIAAGSALSFVEHAETIERARAMLTSDLRAVYANARAQGYDPKALRAVVAMRRKSGDVHPPFIEALLRAIEARREAERRLAEALKPPDPQRSFAEIADGQERARWEP